MFLDADYFSISSKTDPKVDIPPFLDRPDLNIQEMHVEFL